MKMKIIKSDNPQIDVEWLMDNFREAVGREKGPLQPEGRNRSSVDNSRVEALLSTIESGSRRRTQFPNALRRFPFSWSHRLQGFILKVYELLFREQRTINMSIAYALREIHGHHIRLAEQIIRQQASISERLDQIAQEQRHINSVVSEPAEDSPLPRPRENC